LGQKTNPIGFRIGINKDWYSRWFDDGKEMSKKLKEDTIIRRYLMERLKDGWVSRIEIERTSRKLRVIIFTARPGLVIGKGGDQVESLKAEIKKLIGWEEKEETEKSEKKGKTEKKDSFQLDVKEIKVPELDARLVAYQIARQIEKRVSYRRAMKRAVQNAIRFGAKGIKVKCSGRLGGAEIARSEWYKEGRTPLHTIDANIDYWTDTAFTTAGTVGVKVWIFKEGVE